MKLKLEHLAAYLPYKLKANSTFLRKTTTYTLSVDNLYDWLKGDHRLILHPLSEYCGKVTAGEAMKLLNCSMKVINEIWDLESDRIELEEISLETYSVMCKNHIDFNKFIKSGLAINKNTL
jgi:hypothetical protein